MSKKKLKKILKRSLNPQAKSIFNLILQVEKTSDYISMKDLVDYQKLLSLFKNNLTDLQKDLFLEIYKSKNMNVDNKSSEFLISLNESNFRDESLMPKIKKCIYKALLTDNLVIDYVKVNDERRDITAVKFFNEKKLKEIDFKENEKEEKLNQVYIMDEKDDIIKGLYINKMLSISILPY